MPGLETTLRRKQYHLAMQKYFSVGRELRADRFHMGCVPATRAGTLRSSTGQLYVLCKMVPQRWETL